MGRLRKRIDKEHMFSNQEKQKTEDEQQQVDENLPYFQPESEDYGEEVYPEYPPQQQVAPPPQPQYVPQYRERPQRQNDGESPLSILDEIKSRPAPKGSAPVMIGGRPVDLHDLEEYVIKISPYSLKTILRYHNARTIEELKSYSRMPSMKMNSKTLILIMVAVGMAILGFVFVFFMPEILAMFQGGI